MNDRSSLTVLADAFAELERRADVVTAEVAYVPPAAARHRRWPVVAAAAAGVAVVATGAALLAQPDGHSGHPAAGGHSSGRTLVASPSPSPSAADRERVPSSPKEIARRFRAVLGNSATFTVTDTGHGVTATAPSRRAAGGSTPVVVANGRPNGAAIVGQLTAGGVTGGYDVQMLAVSDGVKASCDSPVHCWSRVYADGATIAIGEDELEGGGVTYVADFVRADGTEVLLHVSNRKDPKGAGAVLAPRPPLTKAQMRAIVTSNRW